MIFSFPLFWREFHIARAARDSYQFDAALFATDGRLIVADFAAAHTLAARINEARDAARFPDRAVRASHLNALGLLDEIGHAVIARYRREINPQMLSDALTALQSTAGADLVGETLRRFVDLFPPLAVYRGEIGADEYLRGQSDGVTHREIALEELLMLHLANSNGAAAGLRELFDDSELTQSTAYAQIIGELEGFFDGQPRFGPHDENLFDLLRAPMRAVPHSLAGQLEFLGREWGEAWLGELLRRTLSGLDFVSEEEKPTFHGPGPSRVPDYKRARLRSEIEIDEPENFSADRHWMPEVVMLAKNAYVWLEQLCRQYGRAITSLDQIPDAELDDLQARGFSGLWLIGLWERSRASKTIKQKCGNPDAEASAYSLLRYEIADDLGGWPALENLRERAALRGIRLASDMVPNHMGIDADWLIEHPDWFIARPQPPFATYSFSGPNLSPRDDVGIFLEDHYYTQNDAAVVFQRVDTANNDVRYIYHGNDGTLMPWNDTAQLDYLKSEVREAVLQTILHVARHFPIIRFDAAMTLAKRHYQRLWFPEPGSGGDIPSRAESGLTADEFDALVPTEFWREVVDRVAVEAPDTLLLAEAFWMMEGYFVRTLGMHRVYNSAFMNMLRDEENANYRLVIKNTLEFDPEILQRFVNFMNNPDEKTAREQFGDGDKYFGICTLMATLPGLPMFGHGQIEGFSEKYGMEYRQAKWHEMPDEWLIERHEREIFPLLRRRALFAAVENFALFDFWTDEGEVDENVFAYANGNGNERALVIFHNYFGDARGWLRWSAGAIDKASREIVRRDLAHVLALTNDARYFVRANDVASGLQFLFSSHELCENGMQIELTAYERRVLIDIREIEDADGRLAALHHELKGRGVESIEIALRERDLSDLHAAFDALVEADWLRRLMPAPHFGIAPTTSGQTNSSVEAMALDFVALEEMERRATVFFQSLDEHAPADFAVSQLAADVRERLSRVAMLHQVEGAGGRWLREHLSDCASWSTLLGWAIVADLTRATNDSRAAHNGDFNSPIETIAPDALRHWLLDARLKRAFRALDVEEKAADFAVDAIATLGRFPLRLDQVFSGDAFADSAFWRALFADETACRALGVNRHDGALWFNREVWETLAAHMTIVSALSRAPLAAAPLDAALADQAQDVFDQLCERAAMANYQVEILIEGIAPVVTTALRVVDVA